MEREANVIIDVKVKMKVKVREEEIGNKESKRRKGEVRKVNVKGRLVIVDPGVLKLNLTPPSKFMVIM